MGRTVAVKTEAPPAGTAADAGVTESGSRVGAVPDGATSGRGVGAEPDGGIARGAHERSATTANRQADDRSRPARHAAEAFRANNGKNFMSLPNPPRTKSRAESATIRTAVRETAPFVPKCHTSIRPTVVFVPFLERFVRNLGPSDPA